MRRREAGSPSDGRRQRKFGLNTAVRVHRDRSGALGGCRAALPRARPGHFALADGPLLPRRVQALSKPQEQWRPRGDTLGKIGATVSQHSVHEATRVTSQCCRSSSCGHCRGLGLPSVNRATFHAPSGVPRLRKVTSVSITSRLVAAGAHTPQKLGLWAKKDILGDAFPFMSCPLGCARIPMVRLSYPTHYLIQQSLASVTTGAGPLPCTHTMHSNLSALDRRWIFA